MRRRIIIDTDPGIDDAVAILLALAADELEVLGIIAVAGNLSLAQTERNAERVHAETSQDRLLLPEPTMPLQSQHGVDFLIETLRAAETGTITVCALGP